MARKGKNSGKMIGEVAQVDTVAFEWFCKKLSNVQLQEVFNIGACTVSKMIKEYKFEVCKETQRSRRSENIKLNRTYYTGSESPLFSDKTGEKFITKQGYEVEIVNYISSGECEYEFTHDRDIKSKSAYSLISSGRVSYPYHKTVNGVGYLGVGIHKGSREEVENKKYGTWHSFIQRSYCPKLHKRNPSYKDVTVCKEWHNFQNFGEWFEENYNPETMQDWEFDKDILVKGSRVYSPETCAFVPREINLLFTKNKERRGDFPIGVFLSNGRFRASARVDGVTKYFGSYDTPEEAFLASKKGKEDYIKQKADEWKDLISPRVYQAMYNYQVEITD